MTRTYLTDIALAIAIAAVATFLLWLSWGLA